MFDGLHEVCECAGCDDKLAGVILPPLAQLFACEMNLPFRVAMQAGVVLGVAFDPLAIHESKGCADIERVIADRNLRDCPGRIAKVL